MKTPISVEQKKEILRQSKGRSVSQLAADFHLPYQTIRTILDKREILLRGIEDGVNKDRKRLRGGKNKMVEEALLAWIRDIRGQNIAIDGQILKEKALEFAKIFNATTFKASNGWLEKFKGRHGLSFRSIKGESASVNKQNVSHWRQNVMIDILTEYEPKDVFNVDETGLFWRVLPDRTITFRGDSCEGGKKSKERITVLLGGNMDGSEKIPLLVIGKSKRPRCFKKKATLPVHYEANSRAWMTGEIFEKFLRNWDRRLGKRKILLLLDNCPSHLRLQLDNIKIQFFVPNATAVIQPCDQGIIQNFKVHYRKLLLRQRILAIDNGVLFNFDLLDALHVAHRAWTAVKGETIANCFRKAGIYIDEEIIELQNKEDLDEMEDLWKRYGLNEEIERDAILADFLDMDKNAATSGNRSISEIASSIARSTEVDEDSTDEEENVLKPEVTQKEAFRAFSVLRQFLRDTTNDISIMHGCDKIEDYFHERSSRKAKQTRISDFFSA